ncbi:MAG: hypothetical protein WKF52_00360 [Sphingomicrobium sp.]
MPEQDRFKTEQEAFWAGKFGDEYISRNRSDQLAANLQSLNGVVIRTRAGRDHQPVDTAGAADALHLASEHRRARQRQQHLAGQAR